MYRLAAIRATLGFWFRTRFMEYARTFLAVLIGTGMVAVCAWAWLVLLWGIYPPGGY